MNVGELPWYIPSDAQKKCRNYVDCARETWKPVDISLISFTAKKLTEYNSFVIFSFQIETYITKLYKLSKVPEFYQNRGWTIDINLSIATDTVAHIDPFKDICRIGRSQGSRKGWINAWMNKKWKTTLNNASKIKSTNCISSTLKFCYSYRRNDFRIFSFSSRHFTFHDMTCHKLLFLSDKNVNICLKIKKIRKDL